MYQLYIGFGLLGGIGWGLTYNTSRSILPKYFVKYEKFVAGFTACGTGVGSLLLPPIIKALDDAYGWRGTILLIAGIQAQCIFFCALYRPIQTDSGTLDKGKKQASHREIKASFTKVEEQPFAGPERDGVEKPSPKVVTTEVVIELESEPSNIILKTLSLFKRVYFVCICLHSLFYQFNYGVVHTHFGSYVLSIGYTVNDVVLLYMIMGITIIVARLIIGILAEVIHVNHCLVVTIAALLNGIFTICLPFTNELGVMFAYGALLNILLTPFCNLELPMITEAVLPSEVPSAFGVMSFFRMPGNVFGAPLAG